MAKKDILKSDVILIQCTTEVFENKTFFVENTLKISMADISLFQRITFQTSNLYFQDLENCKLLSKISKGVAPSVKCFQICIW